MTCGYTYLHVLARHVSGAFVVPVPVLIQAVHLHALKIGVVIFLLCFLRRGTLRLGLISAYVLTRVHHARGRPPRPEREPRWAAQARTDHARRRVTTKAPLHFRGIWTECRFGGESGDCNHMLLVHPYKWEFFITSPFTLCSFVSQCNSIFLSVGDGVQR